MRKTKIICTLGPATDSEEVLKALIKEGMDVARLNFSHGTHEDQKRRLTTLRLLRERYGRPVAALLDTKGPEIRVKDFENGSVELHAGDTFILTGREVMGTVTEILDSDIHCLVKNGGTVSNHKGVNVPDVHLSMPYLSEKDREDILFGIAEDVDYIAASFVRTAEDVRQIRNLLENNDGGMIKIMAKIENREGVDHIDEIIEASDAIMIARGDMGVEIPTEEVPVIQKMIIKKVYEAGKQVITATQMLDSMMQHPRPTRAETTDVANAIYDGTSAIMLSGETAAGDYPVEAVKMMVKIAKRAEEDIDYRKRFFQRDRKANPDITDAVSHATCTTAMDLNGKAILTVTKSGRTARMISKYRVPCYVIGGTTKEKVARQLNMSWGVTPLLLEEKNDVNDLFVHALEEASKLDYLEKDDIVVITAGVPIGLSGTTNMIKVQVIE